MTTKSNLGTTIGKCLVVLITCVSIGFLATATVVVQGGKNWAGIAQANKKYSFTSTTTNGVVNYQAEDNLTLKSVGSPGILPQAVIAAVQHDISQLKSKTADNTKKIKAAQNDTAQYEKLKPLAKEALATKIKAIREELAKIDAENAELSKEIVKLTTESNEILTEATKRRGDVVRLQSQLDEVRTENFRLKVQRSKLNDRFIRHQQTLNILKRRYAQLTGKTRTAAAQ